MEKPSELWGHSVVLEEEGKEILLGLARYTALEEWLCVLLLPKSCKEK